MVLEILLVFFNSTAVDSADVALVFLIVLDLLALIT
jgi:hypothetical protein